MNVAIQLFSVRNAYTEDRVSTLKALREMGYEGVEFAGIDKAVDAKELRALCEEIGLVPISSHIAHTTILNDVKGVLDYCVELGLKYIAIPWVEERCRPGNEGFNDFVQDIETIAKETRARGIQLLYHNHDFEFRQHNGEYALDYIYSTIDKELLGAEIDTAWVRASAVDPAGYVRKYADRSHVVHLKDFAGQRGDYASISIEGEKPIEDIPFEFRPVGYGVQNFKRIIDAVNDTCAEWVVVEQDSPSMGHDELECARLSIDYLKTLIK